MKAAKAWGSCTATEITDLYKDCDCFIFSYPLSHACTSPMRYLSIIDFRLDHWGSKISKNLPESKKDKAWASYSQIAGEEISRLTQEAVFGNYHGLFHILPISNTWSLPLGPLKSYIHLFPCLSPLQSGSQEFRSTHMPIVWKYLFYAITEHKDE